MELYHVSEEVDNDVRAFASKMLDDALEHYVREERQAAQDEVERATLEHFAEKYPDKAREIKDSLYYLTKEKVRAKILDKGIRPDGRKLTEVRKIWCEHGVLPRVHGKRRIHQGADAGFDDLYARHDKRTAEARRA